MELELATISATLTKTISYVRGVCGEPTAPVPIADDKALVSTQENIATLKALEKSILEYFAPRKKEAKKPYDELLEQERVWKEAVNKVFVFADARVREYNDRKRREIQERERIEAEKRAEEERKRLDAEKAEAMKAGNTEQAEVIEEVKQATVAGYVPERKMMSRSEMNTMSESSVIEDFQITNHEEFAAALLSSGKGSLIVLDSKTSTQFKKYLLANQDVSAFPGTVFRRDWKTNYKTRV